MGPSFVTRQLQTHYNRLVLTDQSLSLLQDSNWCAPRSPPPPRQPHGPHMHVLSRACAVTCICCRTQFPGARPSPLGVLTRVVAQLGRAHGWRQHVPLRLQSVCCRRCQRPCVHSESSMRAYIPTRGASRKWALPTAAVSSRLCPQRSPPSSHSVATRAPERCQHTGCSRNAS